jgi:hypothetical protein
MTIGKDGPEWQHGRDLLDPDHDPERRDRLLKLIEWNMRISEARTCFCFGGDPKEDRHRDGGPMVGAVPVTLLPIVHCASRA